MEEAHLAGEAHQYLIIFYTVLYNIYVVYSTAMHVYTWLARPINISSTLVGVSSPSASHLQKRSKLDRTLEEYGVVEDYILYYDFKIR